MSEPSPARPRQVTLAAWLIMVGSVIVVAMVFDQVAGLHTLETRASVEKFLSEPPGNDLGISADAVLTLLRTVAMVAAGCATAAAILGYQVLRRSRSARMALSVIAVPLFLTGLVTGGFVSSVVAASAVMLWLQPARDWFDGITRQPAPAAGAAPAPVGPPPAGQPARPAPYAAPYPAPYPTPYTVPATRPRAVVWACVLTWVFSSIAILGMVGAGVALALEPQPLIDRAREQNPELSAQGVTDNLLLGVTFAMVVALVLWCISAIVLAVFTFRRAEWARIMLVICAGTAAALSLAGLVFGAFLLAFSLVGSVAVAALLIRPDVRPWFAKQR
ncbi:hypothetical protein [Nocardioides sp. SR21]|uniref:hypothetical protein n=1 Tax=Nocardioides sp. SR21 TaxID=2919501 RepID=UPI001FA98F29|nr:hypothetical protein [Nocardioides sp. SR21]